MIYRIEAEVVAPVNPTEDPERVARAIRSVFPNADIEEGHGELVATAHAVDRLAELLETQRIQETARATLMDCIEGDTIAFAISKQAALAGVVTFALDEPAELGDIHVRIRVEQPAPDQLVEAMTAPAGLE